MDLEKTVNKLIDNEEAIVDTVGGLIGYLETIDKRFAHLEGHIGQLSKRPAVIVKPNSRFFLLTAVVASGYFGYKLADRRFREKVQEMVKQAAEEAQAKFEQAKQSAQEQMKPANDVSEANHPSVREAAKNPKPERPFPTEN